MFIAGGDLINDAENIIFLFLLKKYNIGTKQYNSALGLVNSASPRKIAKQNEYLFLHSKLLFNAVINKSAINNDSNNSEKIELDREMLYIERAEKTNAKIPAIYPDKVLLR